MAGSNRMNFRELINYGLLAALVSLSFSVIGMVELFSKRDLIAGVLSLGQVFLFAPSVAFAYIAASKAREGMRGESILNGLVTAFVSALPLAILVLLATNFDLRQFLPNVSPKLVEILTFNMNPTVGTLVLIGFITTLGIIAAGLYLLPVRYRDPIFKGVLWTLVVGMFSEILSERLRAFFGPGFIKLIFTGKAIKPIVALALFVSITAFSYWWGLRGGDIKERMAARNANRSKQVRWGVMALVGIILLTLPLLLGTYLSEVVNNVLIYVLMGFGLNIVVGFAGLLDLGYVAFFAIGAYTMALLTSASPLGIAGLSFWAALPICVMVAVMFGIMLGIPVLRMRGDYLAIVTLGFGEIIRILALSDLLKPFNGGAQGVLQINKPVVFGISLIQPDQFYYVVLAGCALAAFVSWRLSESRLGRQWMALREDEDVAEAMGINLVSTKLLAFGIGAAFSGLYA